MVFIQHPSSPNIHHTEIPRRGPIRKNKKTSTPPWSWLGWVRLPMSRATGVWWASSSSLRTRFSPPLSSPTAIDGKRRSSRTQIAPHPTPPPPPPHEKPAGPSIAPPIAPRPAKLRLRRRYAPHEPSPQPPDSLVSRRPVRCSPCRLDRPTQHAGKPVSGAIGLAGAIPTGVVGFRPAGWNSSGGRRGYLGFLIAIWDAGLN
jgi:hypothetical protein